MNLTEAHLSSLALVRRTLFILLAVALAGQLLLDQSRENLICNVLAAITFVAGVRLIIHPRSALMGPAFTGAAVLLVVTANSLAPMVGTLVEGNSLVNNLVTPVETYWHRLLFAASLLGGHLLAASLPFLRKPVSTLGSVLGTNVFLPTPALWVCGGLGMGFGLARYILPEGSALGKLFEGFAFLGLAPYLTLVAPYRATYSSRIFLIPLFLLYGLQSVLSVAGNSRMGMLAPIFVVLAAQTLSILLGLVLVDGRWLKRAALTALGAGVAFTQFYDLSTAILIERAHRETRSSSAQLIATVERFFDKQSLRIYREEASDYREKDNQFDTWREDYIDNPLIGRFVSIKFDDNCLVLGANFGDSEIDALEQATLAKVQSILPGPLLKALGISVDKERAIAYSIGDLFDSLSKRLVPWERRLTGSVPAHGFALFGWMYPVYFLAGYTVLFLVFQGLVAKPKTEKMLYGGLSTLGMLLVFRVFRDISFDGINNPLGLLLRGVWEVCLIYAMLILILNLFGVKSRKGGNEEEDDEDEGPVTKYPKLSAQIPRGNLALAKSSTTGDHSTPSHKSIRTKRGIDSHGT